MTSAERQLRHSVCALDCPDCCSLLVTIENGRALRLRGDPDHPITQGFLCAKVTRYLERVYHPARLLYPHKRAGRKGEGHFVRISWDEALDAIAARLKQVVERYGSESVLPYSYAGTMGLLNNAGMDRRFFHRLGASRLERTICSAAGSAGLTEALGMRYGTEPEQFRHARLILAWGANILGANVHLWPFIQRARRNGARFYVIDPVVNRTGALADQFFPIQPGTDLALAMGLIHVILEEGLEDRDYIERHTRGIEALKEKARQYPPERVEALTGIPRHQVVALAREYATTRPAVIRLNYGVQRSERGGSAVQAIAYLPVITGSWKDAGGGLLLSTSQAFHLNRAALERPDLQLRSPLGRPARLVNMVELGKALTELDGPRVHALIVYNSNPAAVAPNSSLVLRGLAREDLFTVVIEQFVTDTADYADLLLPATTFLEHTDLYLAYGHYYLQLARPALEPLGEAKSNVEIFRLLAKRMGFDDPCFDDGEDDLIRALLDSPHPFLKGIKLERLERERFVRLNVSEAGAAFLPFAEGGFPTADGRCEFRPQELDYTPPVESRLGDPELRKRYPLELVSSKNDDSMNSTFGYRDDTDRQTATLWMHQSDAAARNISNGDAVRVFNDRGSVILQASVNGKVRPGVVRAPSLRWPKRSPNGAGINVLTADRLTDLGGGPVFYSCLVEVERCGD